jgi:hypothetical protein
MALPDKNDWKACISYFSKNKKDKANLGVISGRVKEYIRSGKVDLGSGSSVDVSLAKTGTKKNVKKNKRRSKSAKRVQ